MSADAQFKSFIDRILRCREAEDAAKEDTKAVYAEMKAEGYDKTAAGALVAELRKQDKNPDKFNEASAILDLYRDAYQRASGTTFATHTHASATSPVDREARAKRRTSEAMDDNKAFSKELLDAGLITQEAHAENVAISDGVARKYGAGVIETEIEGEQTHLDRGTPAAPSMQGGQTNPHSSLLSSSRQETKAEATDLLPGASATLPECSVGGGDDRTSVEEVHNPNLEEGVQQPPSLPDNDFEPPSFLLKSKGPLRPHCLNPDLCAGVGRNHCWSCRKASGLSEVA